MSSRRRADKTQTEDQTRILWDDSNVRSHHPKFLSVSGGHEEIILSFGSDQALDVGQDLDPYQLSDRIVMSPFTAKRLVILLNNIIEECESKYGSLDMKPSPANGPDQDPVHRPDFSETRRSDEKVDLLLKLVKNLNIELGLERSFKISEKTVLGNRFLLGTSKSAIRQRPDERILHICERMEMPGNLLEASRENLSDANYIHFGLEGNLSSCIYYVIKY